MRKSNAKTTKPTDHERRGAGQPTPDDSKAAVQQAHDPRSQGKRTRPAAGADTTSPHLEGSEQGPR